LILQPTFLNSTEYYVKIDAGAIQDTSANDYAGIADTTTWSFTTVAATPPPPPPSGGGGGGFIPAPTSCSSVTYGDWGLCANGLQYRDVLTRTPSGCTLTTTQEAERSRTCSATVTSPTDTSDTSKQEKSFSFSYVLTPV
jgi:hypothetical protein